TVWRCRDKTFFMGRRVLIMGVLNVTPDSFSDGGKFFKTDKAVERALVMAEEGADVIDIGGESTRPGAKPVPAEEELRRVIPVVEQLKKYNEGLALSIDTSKAAVAREALDRGVEIVNDVTALTADPEMAKTVAPYGAGLVLMHMQGSPRTMQEAPHYKDVIAELGEFFDERLAAVEEAGFDPEQVVLDPGIGFGKTLEHNLTILAHLRELERGRRPLLVGVSRKSFLRALLNLEDDESRLMPTAGAVAAAVVMGAQAVRVHDVGEMAQVVRVAEAIRGVKIKNE
ncbi:MAG: dihydropteroate synthase, partial [bacterium]